MPLAGGVRVSEVSGPLEEEGWGVAVECDFFVMVRGGGEGEVVKMGSWSRALPKVE